MGDLKLDNLEMSVRTSNNLEYLGVKTLDKLMSLTVEDLLKVPVAQNHTWVEVQRLQQVVTKVREGQAVTRFAAAVCGLFEDDPNWSVHDLDGAEEFFAQIGFVPSESAVSTE